MNGADRAAEGRCMLCMAWHVDGWFCRDCAMATTQQHNSEEMQSATGSTCARQAQRRLARDSAHNQWMAMLSIPDVGVVIDENSRARHGGIPGGRSRRASAARKIIAAVSDSLPGDLRTKDRKRAATARKERKERRRDAWARGELTMTRREFYSTDPDGQRPMASMYRRRSTTPGR